MTTVYDGLYQYGGMPVTGGLPPFLRSGSKAFFVDPVNGLDGNKGTTPDRPFASLYKAHKMCTSGNNDVVFLIGDGTTTNTCRLSTANATAADSTLTTGELLWTKSATHLVGVAAPGANSRARISTPTGTYTTTTFGSASIITVSGSGCYFANLSLTTSFSTGSASELALVVSGSYNVFNNVFVGQLSTATIQGTGARALKVSGGENTFIECQIGVDTVTRTVANSNLELSGGAARNKFIRCIFPVMTSSADVHVVLGTGNNCIDRWTLFDECIFANAINSTSTQADDAVSFSTAAPGGMLILRKCDTVGFTKIGDTNGLANTYVSNVGGAATDGLMLNPS